MSSTWGRAPLDAALERRFREGGWWGDASMLDWWVLAARSVPDHTAVVDRLGTRYTYAEADDLSSRVATWFRSKGVGPGDTVAVQLPNRSEFLPVVLGALKAGATINPLSPNLRRAEVSHALRACGTRVAVVPIHAKNTDFRDLAAELLADDGPLEEVLFVADPEFDAVAQPLLGDVVRECAPLDPADWARPRGDDIAAVLFTSGSEAAPKGVMLTHNNVLASELAFASALGLGVEDSILMPAPLGHATGFLHGVLMPILVRGTSVLCDAVDGLVMRELVREHRITCGMAVPTVVDILLCAAQDDPSSIESLRFLCCGGSPVPRALLQRSRDLGVRLYSVYGATESAPHTMTTHTDSDERVLTTDGRACRGTEIRIVDPTTRRTLPPGVEGEEASRGPAVFAGYLGAPELTSRVLDAEGWYYSGDLAVMDEDGYIRITGRRRDLILRGGENISPAEVENTLMSHPAIRAASVVGFPDALLGERACAFLVAADGAPELRVSDVRDWFIDAGLAKMKIPERLEYVDALPLTSSGKVAKAELRSRARAFAPSPRAPLR